VLPIGDVHGDREHTPFSEDLEKWARHVSPKASVKILEGADHYFYGSLDELGEAVASFIAGTGIA